MFKKNSNITEIIESNEDLNIKSKMNYISVLN